ncbi:radical SAM protein [Clostridium perfringens]|nr:radical SAM protein [Clostridium perfringens]
MELTTYCPINCPQCYKDNLNFDELPFEKLKQIIDEVSELGTDILLLSGGEPMMYEHIVDAINYANGKGIKIGVSTSGVSFDKEKLDIFSKSNLNTLYISLNGSTEEINSLSRDEYNSALNLIKDANRLGIKCKINWVARHDNINDLSSLIKLAKDMNVAGIDILSNKPGRDGIINSPMTKEDFNKLVEILKKDSGFLSYQNCFVGLKNKLDSNKHSLFNGCSAGVYSMAITATGRFKPCPHMNNDDLELSIKEYWYNNKSLNEFRKNNELKSNNCEVCVYSKKCRPCNVVINKSKKCDIFEKVK